MKRQWDAEELVENFTLLPTEMALLSTKSEENRLGFGVLLKFFQMETKFPRTKQEVPNRLFLTLQDFSPSRQNNMVNTRSLDALLKVIALKSVNFLVFENSTQKIKKN